LLEHRAIALTCMRPLPGGASARRGLRGASYLLRLLTRRCSSGHRWFIRKRGSLAAIAMLQLIVFGVPIGPRAATTGADNGHADSAIDVWLRCAPLGQAAGSCAPSRCNACTRNCHRAGAGAISADNAADIHSSRRATTAAATENSQARREV